MVKILTGCPITFSLSRILSAIRPPANGILCASLLPTPPLYLLAAYRMDASWWNSTPCTMPTIGSTLSISGIGCSITLSLISPPHHHLQQHTSSGPLTPLRPMPHNFGWFPFVIGLISPILTPIRNPRMDGINLNCYYQYILGLSHRQIGLLVPFRWFLAISPFTPISL